MLVIPLGKWKQEDQKSKVILSYLRKFEVSLGYRKTCLLKKKVPGEIWVQGYISVVTAIREAEARGLIEFRT